VTFEEFVAAHAPHLMRLSYALCGDRGRAEDAVQDACERVYLRWDKLDDPLPYARQVVLNATRDGWRRVLRRERVVELVPDSRASDGTSQTDDRDLLLRALRTLPHGQRAVLLLRYWEDLTEADTARVLGVSVGTVKSQTARAMSGLREAIPTTDGARS
jgi:RNA polymerase sigma-70 factor (ECF subfamily)